MPRKQQNPGLAGILHALMVSARTTGRTIQQGDMMRFRLNAVAALFAATPLAVSITLTLPDFSLGT